MKVNKIYIITDAPIPIGMAPTNRILSYASGFVENRVDCEIIIFRKTQSSENAVNEKIKGNYGKVKFYYLGKSTQKSKYFLKRRIDNFVLAIKLLIVAFLKINKNNAVIYYSSYNYAAFILFFVKKLKRFLFLKEESEHPSVRKKIKGAVGWIVFNNFHYILFDGLLLMTESLISYFKIKYPKLLVSHIPMTVETNRFDSKITTEKSNFITYVGSLNNNKDGIIDLLESYKVIIEEGYSERLLICGYYNSNVEFKMFRNKIKALEIEKDIDFVENVNSQEIPAILMKSKLLVLPRPDSIQARNGFPTKLGEYLASGTCVVATKIGELPKYLIDNHSVLFALPSNIFSLTDTIKKALNNSDLANNIGKSGQNVAKQYFNNKVQTKSIIKFISTIS